MIDTETHYRLLRYIEQHPEATQRELAAALGVSLGKANYCLKALMERGLIKARNFKNSHNKRAYLYHLTPLGIDSKARVTARFLKRKIAEYEALQGEIELLKREVETARDG